MMSVEVERAHLLADVIERIESTRSDDCFEVATLTYSVKKSEEAYKRLAGAGLYSAP
jgi:hypothetical protein